VAACAGGREVIQYDIAEMAHSWPANGAFGFDVHDTLWDFFSRHTLTR
jgi:poly(3-hydroxybutyrate) depolymerase